MGSEAKSDTGSAVEVNGETTAEPTKVIKRDAFYLYWDRFLAEKPSGRRPNVRNSKPPGRAELISLDMDVEGKPSHPLRRNTQGQAATQQAVTSYEQAAATCREKVQAIVNECRRLNVKYTDRNFVLPYMDALQSLNADEPSSLATLTGIGGVKRVEEIYDNPQFFVDGATANDVRQGIIGDCWFLAAITALSGKPDLIERVCVARDEQAGVYGFVFFRDGQWISEVVDDKLAIKRSDDDRPYPTEFLIKVHGYTDVLSQGVTSDMSRGIDYDIQRLGKQYQDSLRKGSKSLFFASCQESNETWLPLLEKAYAKSHGDYQAIEGGFPGEGIEDLTGGVSTYLITDSILDKDKLWSELLRVNEADGFLFGCSSRFGRDSDPIDDEGFVRGHAYTVVDAKEITDPKDKAKKLRLLKVRNPWGTIEWNGAWSDGSKEWTADTIRELGHTFGDDGLFWIAFTDWLKYFPGIERTRLFGPEWTIAQQWTSVNVPWSPEYLDTKFEIDIEKAGPVVLVLSQPDARYFQGLTGRHSHSLHFRLYREGEATYLARSLEQTGSGRSCSAELDLEAGRYQLFVKIESTRSEWQSTAAEVIKENWDSRRSKLIAIGQSFDLAHMKGRLREREDANRKAAKEEQWNEDKDELKRRRVANKAEKERERARNRRVEEEIKRKKQLKRAEIRKERAEAKASRAAEKAAAPQGSDATTINKASALEKEEGVGADGKTDDVILLTKDSAEVPNTKAVAVDTTARSEDAKGEVQDEVQQPTPSSVAKVDEQSTADTTPQVTPGSSRTSDEALTQAGSSESNKNAEAIIVQAAKDIAEAVEKFVQATVSNQNGPPQGETASAEEGDESDVDIAEEELVVSEVDDNDFDWNSDIDGPADVDTEDDDEPGMYADDPWNATSVIGLRVYSYCKDTKIKLVEHAERPHLGDRGISRY